MMDVQAFYKTLAKVLSERTETEIKVKEIEYWNGNCISRRIQGACDKSTQV